MQNKFGLKDLVLYILVFGLAITVWLKMYQQDRQWEKTQDVLGKLTGLESQISRIQDRLESGVTAAPSPRVAAGGQSPGAQDESWARPGVKVEWQPPYGPATDPRQQPNFTPGGECTEVWEAQLPRITPYVSTDSYSRRVQELVLQSLGDYDPLTLELRGQIADAWQIDPSGLWLRAHIRAGVRFSDGQPVTAEDFRWTFHDYIMNEQIDAERVRSFIRDSIKKVSAIDDRTVEFEFVQPLASNIDNALRTLLVVPKHVYSVLTPGQINRSTGLLVGSGPFRLRDFNPESQWVPPADIILERNEQFWGIKPPLETLRFGVITSEVPRLNAFKKGDADIITPASTQFRSMQQDPSWRDNAQYLEWTNMRSGYSFIAWNCGERNGKLTPFHDKRVRRAMTLMLDRDRMIRDIWSGVGIVAKGNQNPEGPAANRDIKPWPYDPAQARALLKEAGWEDRDGDGQLEDARGNPFEFEFSYASGGEIAERIARFVSDAYAAGGIKVRLRPADWSIYQNFMKLRDFDALTLAWSASSPESDPKQIFHSASIKNQGDNFAQWSSPEADRLIDAGRRELNRDQRMLYWQKLEAVLHDEQPYTFIRVPPWLRIVNPGVKNIRPYFKGLQHDEFFRGGPAAPSTAN